jgi:hypothetical protein
MRVSIEHREATSGLFKKVTQYEVVTTIQFTEEERAVIKKRELENTIVLEREPNARKTSHLRPDEKIALADVFHLKISGLLKGTDVYTCDTPLEAQQYDGELKQALQQLKAYIGANADARVGVETFEL